MDIEKVTLKNGKSFYVKDRGKRGIGIVYPLKKDLSKPFSPGNMNWKALLIGGSWGKFMGNTFFMLLILSLAWSYSHDISAYEEVYSNPCCYCKSHLQNIQMNTEDCVNVSFWHDFDSLDFSKFIITGGESE